MNTFACMNKATITSILLFSLLFSLSRTAICQSFPYALKKTDAITLTVGATSLISGKLIEQNQALMTNEELLNLDKKHINSFDRSATSNWNKDADLASELIKLSLAASPVTILADQLINKQWQNSFTYATMYFETALLTYGITQLTKATTKRIRPYMYNINVSTDQKDEYINNRETYDSFFSGSTSIAFASAVFLSSTYTDIYGQSIWSKVIWTTSISAATAVGYLRYESGYHYPTDIITGAIVGSAIGYLIPILHKKNNKIENFSFLLSGNGFYLAYKL